MRTKINYTHKINEIANYNGIILNLETGRIFGEGRAFYTLKVSGDQYNYEADTARGWESMRSAYEKAALAFNDLVPLEATIPIF